MTCLSSRLPILLVALAVVCSVAAVAIPVGAADIQSAERTIQDTELEPGETTTVIVEVEQTRSENIAIFETVEPAPGALMVTDTDPVGSQFVQGNEVLAFWENEQSVLVEYDVKIPGDAQPGDTYTITNEDLDVSGDDQINVAGDDDDDGGNDDDGGDDDGGGDDGGNDDDGGDDGAGGDDDGTDDDTDSTADDSDDGNTTDNDSDDGDTRSANQQDDSEDDDSQGDDGDTGDDDSPSTDDTTTTDDGSENGDDDGSEDGDSIPGFGVLTAIGALLAAGAIARRRA